MTKRWGVSSFLMLTIGVTLLIEPGRGQSKPMNTADMTNRAAIVVVGSVVSMQSEWSGDRTRIVTQVTVAVDQYLKGNQQDRTLTITVPGGEVDGVGEFYSHTAKFKRNEEVVVFADRDAQGNLRVTDGEAGKMVITRDAATGRRVIDRNQPLEVLTTQVKAAVKAAQQE